MSDCITEYYKDIYRYMEWEIKQRREFYSSSLSMDLFYLFEYEAAKDEIERDKKQAEAFLENPIIFK